MSKKLGAVHCHNSLVLRFACKAFRKPSVFNQVLFHKTCGGAVLATHFYTMCYCNLSNSHFCCIVALRNLLSFDEKITCLSFDFGIIFKKNIE